MSKQPPREGGPVTKRQLAGTSITREVALITVWEDGSMSLGHVQADIVGPDGKRVGSIVFNGTVELPVSRFEWAEVEG